jgi:hypothetical protein
MLKEGIHILPTKTTPEIILKPSGIIKIKGRSTEKKYDTFSKPVFDWADRYICDPAETTNVDINLDNIDKVHSARLLSFLRRISTVKQLNKKLIINWYYLTGNKKSFKRGQQFSVELKIPFNFFMISG